MESDNNYVIVVSFCHRLALSSIHCILCVVSNYIFLYTMHLGTGGASVYPRGSFRQTLQSKYSLYIVIYCSIVDF